MTAAKNVREALDRDTAIGLIEFWWRCVEAGREIDGDDTLADDAVILHYSGCGASAIVTAGHFRALLSATAAGDADVVGDLRRMYQLGQTYWQQADSDWTSQHRKADVTDKAAKDIIAKYAAKGALPMASRAEIPKTPDWEEIDTLLASAAVGQAYSEERRICAIRDHLKSWLYALETERLLTKPHAPSPACVNAIAAKEPK